MEHGHIPRPAHRIHTGQQHREISAHAAVEAGCAGVSLHERRVEGDAAGNAGQLADRHADHERDVAGAGHGDHRLRSNRAGVGNEGAGGRERQRRRVFHVPEGLTAEIDRKRAVLMIAQHLRKLDLVGNPRMIKATQTGSQFERSRAAQPCADLLYPFHIGNGAFHGKNEIVVYIVGFQRGKGTASTRRVGKGHALRRSYDSGLLGDMDAVGRAAGAVPFKPVFQADHLQSKRPHPFGCDLCFPLLVKYPPVRRDNNGQQKNSKSFSDLLLSLTAGVRRIFSFLG